jgi:hypothetical protein
MTDQQVLLNALRDAGKIVGEYLEPGPQDAVATINRLIEVLDNQKLATAIKRLEADYAAPELN